MFDFTSLTLKPRSECPATLIELFGQLDRKATHISLRPAQAAALRKLDEQAGEKDIVLKLSTGSGKTVVGLVYAEMMRCRYKGDPILYVCPTIQLVEQVLQSAQAIGAPASTFPVSGLPFEALAGESILVCTYDRIFNAISRLEANGARPSAIILDDVHAGVERVRGCYTVRVPDSCFEQFKAMLLPLCESSDPATWRGIKSSSHDARFEVPYWVWSNIQGEAAKLLEPYKNEDEMKYQWGNIARYLDQARVCISGVAAEISLPIAAVEERAVYASAKHRLFMSASIKDGSSFIGDLDCDPQAFKRVIEPVEDEGAGERMMLATSLITPDASKKEIANVCASLAKQTNVVVLTSSEAQSKVWVEAGACLSQGKSFEPAIERLKSSSGNFVVFTQRFDGVDLPDDACRVLVIDGVPSGDRLSDKVDASRQKDSPEYEVRTVNRFEQALGRAVRSSADYAAILLVGTDIAAFIGKRSVRELLESRTRVQVDLGKDLVKLTPGTTLPAAVNGMVQAILSRNEQWKEAHRARVREAEKTVRQGNEITVHETIALAARVSWKSAKGRNFQAAVPVLRDACNNPGLHPVQRGELLYKIAANLHQFDPAAAADAYRAAFEINSDFPRPDKVADKKFARLTNQAIAARDYLGSFAQANAAIAKLDEIAAKLSFAMPADIVEQGILELGKVLGAASSRPERETERGPDNLWLFDDVAFCLEAKSEKTADIFKVEAAQLVLSLEWCREHIEAPERGITPVFVTNSAKADRAEDISFGPMIMTEELVFSLLGDLRQVIIGLSFDGPLFTDPAAIGKAFAANGLSGRQILARLQRCGS
ncbi:DEAD/DEAH box helicase family protein [Pseudomonas syringae]|uniref:DEAD/DEAH box helicase family protein n=1 Tax=Pseudomonas syringae TaxID=317 RepID=UPI000BB5B731|nr:DEAD/DEAH box helicase family protein [Pseudomonas syringae]PBP30858.1 hypothetical protein CCL12_24755 [Pseudomonas syringae]